MKAIVRTRAGPPDVLRLKEVPKPAPKDDELLVKVHAGTVTRGDVILRKIPNLLILPVGLLFGFKARKVPGHEFSGEIESVGSDVRSFKKGDQVFGTTTGLKNGANAEFVCVPEKWKQGVVALKPANASFEEAAAIPIGGMTALYLLQRANIRKGQKVLVYGASGSVGTYAVQLAKCFGAEVTGVSSTTNLGLIRSLGADKVIDHTKEDLAKSIDRYDVIFDAVGKAPASIRKGSLKKEGIRLSIGSPTKELTENLVLLKDLTEAGKIRAVIDRRYPLERTAEAHHYVEQGHKKGNVVITVVKDDIEVNGKAGR